LIVREGNPAALRLMACRERRDELLVLRSWFGDALAANEKRLGGSRKVEGPIKWHRAHRLGQQPQAPCGGIIEQPDRIGRVGHLSLSFASQQRVAAEADGSSGLQQALKRLVETSLEATSRERTAIVRWDR